MARLWSCGFELGSGVAGVEVDNAFTVSPDQAHSGSQSNVVSSMASSLATFQFGTASQYSTVYARAYIYVTVYPNSPGRIFTFQGSFITGYITMTLSGTLQLRDASNVQIGSDSAVVSKNTWHYIEMFIDASPATGSRVLKARLDGVEFASKTNDTSGNIVNVDTLSWGQVLGTAATIYWDDIAINDNSGSFQNSYPGNSRLVYLFPSGSGDSNSFSTQTGGTSGSSNNYTRVNEVPPDDDVTFNGDNTLNQEDLFNVPDPPIGANATINVVHIGGRFRNNIADATTAIKFEVEKTGSGTKSQSLAIVPNTTAWSTNAVNKPRVYPITLYQDPDGSNWTLATLDSMQIGYLLSTGGTNRIDITDVWAIIDYTPGPITTSTSSTSSSSSSSISISSTSSSISSSTSSTSSSTSSTSSSTSYSSSSSTSISSTSVSASVSISTSSSISSSTSSSISSSTSSTSSSISQSSSTSSTSSSTSMSLSTSQSFTTSTSSTSNSTSSTSASSTSSSTSQTDTTTISTSSTSSSISSTSSSTSVSSTSSSTSTTLPPDVRIRGRFEQIRFR